MKRMMIVFGSLCIAGGLVLGGRITSRSKTVQSVEGMRGLERYVAHIATDKPIYRPGEKVYVRGVFLRADDHTPMVNVQNGRGTAAFEIKGPRGNSVASGFAAVADSVVGLSWDVPSSVPGGEYTIRITTPWSDAPAERKFDIRTYRAPRLKSHIVFLRDGYGPGDTVVANLHVERAEGGVPVAAKIAVTARIDGLETWTGTTSVDPSGNASATFKLPATMKEGDGVLAMVIDDGGAVETTAKTIPILLQTLDLQIYPEGGDLVAGLPNRVYIESRTPAHKPADIAGFVVNTAGKQVATVRTEHEGRGRFQFIPVKGQVYSLHISEPAGIQTIFHLPPVKDSGAVMTSTADVIPKQADVLLRVGATTKGDYRLVLSQHGKEITFKSLALPANHLTEVALTMPRNTDGVVVATVYDDHDTPLAERLLFRQPEHHINVKLTADRNDYVPGDKVTLQVKTTDEFGKPVGATVGLTVTDSSVLEMIEKREQAPRLPVMVLLENEVQDLADAQVYLDDSNRKAPLATDLLLGTQGWRRFATAGSGALSGVVQDGRNAIIPGVAVRALNTTTGLVVTAVTNEVGGYAFPALKSGTYQVTAELPGFQSNSAGLQITRGSSARHDFRLSVAAVAEMVQVGGGRGGAFRGVLGGVLRMAPPEEAAAFRRVIADDAKDVLNRLDLVPPPPMGRPGAINALQADRQLKVQARPAANTIREYAHTRRPDWSEGSRTDFTETVYWNAGIKTDPSTGSASVAFNLSDSVTAFRVVADGFGEDGSLGSATSEISAVQPFSIEPKLPLQVTSGDVIQLPIGLINGVNRSLPAPQIAVNGPASLQLTSPDNNLSALGPKERARRFVQITVGNESGGALNLTIDGKAGPYHDTVTRSLDVQPIGFPQESATGGKLERNGAAAFEFTLPSAMVLGSVASNVTIYPTPLASMTDALQNLLQQPNGCFEQTSSTSYPLTMAQQYFLTHTGVDPALIEKAKGLLEVSYKKLTGFESRSHGYEWFGADPGHEALTAYGLLQFSDMSQVRTVDKDMMERTRAWLLARRDGKGGFSVNPKALDSFGRAPSETTNAYIVWALTEAGEKGLEREAAAIKTSADSTQDSYVIALAANILHATGDRAGARQLMDKLVRNQEPSGSVKGAVTSITRSGGDGLAIETTSLSVLAWLREPSYAPNVEKAMKWIVESNRSGRYGSTQSTILALRSIVAYDKANAHPKAPGRLVLTVDGKNIGSPVAFTADSQGAIAMPDFAGELAPGKHNVVLRMQDGSSMPFSMSVKYHSIVPNSSDQSKIDLQVALKNSQIQEGSATEATVSITNKSDGVIPTPVAVIGIPGGLEVRHDQLKELVKSGKIDAYEVRGREIVLYWRYLKANAKFDLPLSLIAAIPGSYTGPASRAYLYYTDEYKSWAPGLKVTIIPR